MGRRRGSVACVIAAAALAAGSGVTAEADTPPPSSVVTGHVLVYGPSLAEGDKFSEASAARELGYTVAIADKIAWSALTEADFAHYDAIIVGDPSCRENVGDRYLRLAARTQDQWTPAVTGNVALLGTDTVFHVREGVRAARRLTVNGLRYATAGSTTGAYLALGCAYADAPAFTPVPVLSGFGPFTVRGQYTRPLTGCPDRVRVVDPLSPLVRKLTDHDLSNWTCAIHEGFDAYPFPFQAVAVHRRSELPYLLTRPPTTAGASDDLTVFSGATSERPSEPAKRLPPNDR